MGDGFFIHNKGWLEQRCPAHSQHPTAPLHLQAHSAGSHCGSSLFLTTPARSKLWSFCKEGEVTRDRHGAVSGESRVGVRDRHSPEQVGLSSVLSLSTSSPPPPSPGSAAAEPQTRTAKNFAKTFPFVQWMHLRSETETQLHWHEGVLVLQDGPLAVGWSNANPGLKNM